MAIQFSSDILEIVRSLLECVREEKAIYSSQTEIEFFSSPPRPLEVSRKPSPLQQVEHKPEPKSQTPILQPSIAEPVLPPTKQPPATAAKTPLPEERTPPPPQTLSKGLLGTYQQILSKMTPPIAVIRQLPDDRKAKALAERWKTNHQAVPFSILVLNEPLHHRRLLEGLATALETVFGGASLIDATSLEKEKKWELFLAAPHLKQILICDYTLWQMPHLLTFYRETNGQSERFLQQTPLFLLPDLSLYLKDPLLKRSLWKALCQKLS